MLSAEKQELVVYEAYNEQKHEHGEEHHHPRALAIFREHAQLQYATKEKFVNKILSNKHAQADGKKVHEDFEGDESRVWRIPEKKIEKSSYELWKKKMCLLNCIPYTGFFL